MSIKECEVGSHELANKVIVVTGGKGLLGKALVRSIATHGGHAIAADINVDYESLFTEDRSGEECSGDIGFLKMDITSSASIRTAIAEIDARYGRIDALVNAAYPRNKNYGRKFEDVSYADFCMNLSTHVGGYFLTSQQFAAYFKQQGLGAIVNIASIYGVVAPRFEVYQGSSMTMPVEYAAIKSAVIHLTKYMAKYFKGSNLRVNSISPGGILDGQAESFLSSYNSHGMTKGMLDVEDVMGAMVFLLSDMSKYVNGQNLIVDDGWTL